MEKLMLGEGLSTEMRFGCSTAVGECFSIVRKGHEECGDSAFVFMDDKRAILGVFDGVSGEHGAASASSTAAVAVLEVLKKSKKADEKLMRKAFSVANNEISKGYTTATVCVVEKDGSAIVAGVGDSPVYGLTAEGDIVQELPLARVVGEDHSVLKFFYYRNLVTSVLGPSGADIHIHTRKGKIKKGEIFILATDCLNDNLYVKVKDGYLVDASGADDLKKLIGKLKSPKSMAERLADEITKRIAIGKIEKKDSMLVPKEDDLAIIAFRFK